VSVEGVDSTEAVDVATGVEDSCTTNLSSRIAETTGVTDGGGAATTVSEGWTSGAAKET